MHIYIYHTVGGVGWPRGGRSSWVKSIKNNIYCGKFVTFHV